MKNIFPALAAIAAAFCSASACAQSLSYPPAAPYYPPPFSAGYSYGDAYAAEPPRDPVCADLAMRYLGCDMYPPLPPASSGHARGKADADKIIDRAGRNAYRSQIAGLNLCSYGSQSHALRIGQYASQTRSALSQNAISIAQAEAALRELQTLAACVGLLQ